MSDASDDFVAPSGDAPSAAAASLSRESKDWGKARAEGFQSRHEKVDEDALVELKRRRQWWASCPGADGGALKPDAQIVPFDTLQAAILEIEYHRSRLPPAAARATPPAEVEELVAWLKSRAEMSSDEAEFLGEHEQDGWAADNAADAKKFTATASALTSLSLRVRALEEALKPFVLEAERFHSHVRAFDSVQLPFASADLQRAIDVYRARTVLHGEGDE
jgi:hypothetical protein